ncbi:MAG: hypothetical protein WD576_00260 [Nitriliruptoraceae bacterium]
MLNLLSPASTGWIIGYSIGIAVVLVVVALVVPILVLAYKIGSQARRIDDGLAAAVVNTSALVELRNTITAAETITDGLHRGRTRLGG